MKTTAYDRLSRCALAALAATALPLAALRAELVSQDGAFGPDTITLDTATGIEWLDVPLAQGRSFDDVAAELGPGGEFDGYRYATTDEIMTLWINAGIPDILTGDTPPTGDDFTAANLAPVTALIELLGLTLDNNLLRLTEGFTGTAPEGEPDLRILAELNVCVSPAACLALGITPNTALASLGPNQDPTSATIPYVGHFLIAVPPVQDSDGDGVADDADNCLLVANADQRDTDGDAIGNICDGDFDQSCSVNFSDLGIMKSSFFQAGDLDTDMNGDGTTNFSDLGLLKAAFFAPPGPSGLPNACE